jgi:hypothetical protein
MDEKDRKMEKKREKRITKSTVKARRTEKGEKRG